MSVSLPSPVVHAVGPRPSSSRPVAKLLHMVACAALIGVSGAKIEKLPLVQGVVSEFTTEKDAPAPTSIPAVWIADDNPNVWVQALADVNANPDAITGNDFARLFHALHMSADQSSKVMDNIIVATQTVVVANGDSQLAQRLRQRQSDAIVFLNTAWEDIQGVQPDTLPPPLTPSEEEAFAAIAAQWDEANTLRPQPSSSLSAWEEQSAGAVEGDVETAVRTTGLAAWILPLSATQNPTILRAQAELLIQSNAQLQKATALNGGVLGVNGRVVLDNTHTNQSGGTSKDEHGYIHITSSWETLGHEWLHAWDFSTAPAVRFTQPRTALSFTLDRQSIGSFRDPFGLQNAQRTLLVRLQETSLSPAQKQVLQEELRARNAAMQTGSQNVKFAALEQVSWSAALQPVPNTSPWLEYRRQTMQKVAATPAPTGVDQKRWEKEQTSELYYLSDPTEMLAFYFQGYISLSPSVLNGDIRHQPSVYLLTHTEAQQQQTMWHEYFATVQPWWRSDCASRSPQPLKQALAARRAETGSSHAIAFR